MEVLYPLIRALKIDAREIFNPEIRRESPALRQLRVLIEECSEEEAAAIIPVFQSVITALRDKNALPIEWKRASFPFKTDKLALHFYVGLTCLTPFSILQRLSEFPLYISDSITGILQEQYLHIPLSLSSLCRSDNESIKILFDRQPFFTSNNGIAPRQTSGSLPYHIINVVYPLETLKYVSEHIKIIIFQGRHYRHRILGRLYVR